MTKFNYDDAGQMASYFEHNRSDIEEQLGDKEYKSICKDLYDSLKYYAMDIPWWLEEVIEPGTWLDSRGQLSKGV